MKRLLLLPVILTLCSCASLTPEKINGLAALAGTAAALGAQAYLAAHPEQKPAFDLAITSLSAFIASGRTDKEGFTDLFASLPTDALAAPNSPADLYLSQASTNVNLAQEPNLIIYDKEKGRAIKVEGAATLPVMKATVAGLKKASIPKPPTPVGRVNLRPPVDKGLTRSAGIVSTTDYSPNEFGNPVVTVRWQATAGKIYEIQHRDGTGEWAPFGRVVNVEGAGIRVWTTAWHPSIAPGEWRVVKGK